MQALTCLLPRRALAASLGLALLRSLSAQSVAPAPVPPASPAALPGEETVLLSPFEVTASTDEGYAARETLAGMRFKTELFFGYSRRLGPRVNWRLQLNIRNVLDDRDPMAQRAHISTGATTVYAVPEPRSFILTNSFTF